AAAPFVAAADLTTGSDVDYYAVTLPAGASAFTVALRAGGVSLLASKVTVQTQAGKAVASGTAVGQGGDVTLTVPSAAPGTTYYVKVERAAADVFGVGSYRLAVGGGDAPVRAVAGRAPDNYLNDDGHGNDVAGAA